MSLLKFVLIRWCLDAVSISGVLQFIVAVGANVLSFGVQTFFFCILVASTLAPLGTIERFRETLEHKKGDLGVQAWISVDFGWILEPHLESSWPLLEQTNVFFAMRVPRSCF